MALHLALVAHLRTALASLWTQLDEEAGLLRSSCTWLAVQLRKVQGMAWPAGYSQAQQLVAEAVGDLEKALAASREATFDVQAASSLASTLTRAVTLLSAPLASPSAFDPSRPTLPLEIIAYIFQEVAAQYEWFYGRLELARCCLASKATLPLAREALYRTLRLHISGQDFDDDDARPLDLPDSVRRGSDLAVDVPLLLPTLIAHPHLAILCTSLDLHLLFDDEEMDFIGGAELCGRVLGACPRIVAVSLRGGPGEAAQVFATMLWQSRVNLRKLDIGNLSQVSMGAGSHGHGVWRLLQDLPDLQHLGLIAASDDPLKAPHHSFAFHLESLSLDGGGVNSPQIARALLHSSATSLRNLSLSLYLDAQDDFFDISTLVNLRALCVELETLDPSLFDDKRQRRQLTAWLRTLPSSLVSLRIDTWLERWLKADIIRLDLLPSSLLQLDLSFAAISKDSLLAFIQTRRETPFRSLKYFYGYPSDVRAELDEALREAGIASCRP